MRRVTIWVQTNDNTWKNYHSSLTFENGNNSSPITASLKGSQAQIVLAPSQVKHSTLTTGDIHNIYCRGKLYNIFTVGISLGYTRGDLLKTWLHGNFKWEISNKTTTTKTWQELLVLSNSRTAVLNRGYVRQTEFYSVWWNIKRYRLTSKCHTAWCSWYLRLFLRAVYMWSMYAPMSN